MWCDTKSPICFSSYHSTVQQRHRIIDAISGTFERKEYSSAVSLLFKALSQVSRQFQFQLEFVSTSLFSRPSEMDLETWTGLLNIGYKSVVPFLVEWKATRLFISYCLIHLETSFPNSKVRLIKN